MSVDLEPTELGFQRPFNKEVTQTLHLRNPNSDPIAFKVKTTAPKHYCVRPNSGRIEPGKHMEVQVLLQAMKEEPAPDAKCRDKFLVQSIAVTADQEFSSVASIWQQVEKKQKWQIQERKIRVIYLSADSEGGQTPADHDASPEEEPPAYSSPSGPKFDTPVATRTTQPPTEPEASKQEAASQSSPETQKFSPTVEDSKAQSGVPTAPAGDLDTQLADARSELQLLRQKMQENELRQRKGKGKEGESQPAQLGTKQQQTPQGAGFGGVPVQVVAGLCLLSFLLAYVFF